MVSQKLTRMQVWAVALSDVYWIECFLPTGTTVSTTVSVTFNEILKVGHFFLCIFTVMSNIFTAKEVSSHKYSSRCPAVKGNESQWIQYRDHCYTSDQALHSFSEARRFCSELGKLKCVDFLWLSNLIIGIFLNKTL